MYFESRQNSITNITNDNIEKQIQAIKNLSIGEAVLIGNILWVNDANPSGCGVHEVGVLYKKLDKYYQFESITIDWCNDLEIKSFINDFANEHIINSDYNIESLDVSFFNDTASKVWFQCSCCGNSFQSTISYQSQFDLDAGFGLCNSCHEE